VGNLISDINLMPEKLATEILTKIVFECGGGGDGEIIAAHFAPKKLQLPESAGSKSRSINFTNATRRPIIIISKVETQQQQRRLRFN
jgi:hypothetical protein